MLHVLSLGDLRNFIMCIHCVLHLQVTLLCQSSENSSHNAAATIGIIKVLGLIYFFSIIAYPYMCFIF